MKKGISMRKAALLFVVFALAAWFVWAAVCRAALVVVGRTVPASEQVPVEHIDHSTWDALLRRYVDRQGYVDYSRPTLRRN